jgi:hypothetical protein
MIFPTGNRYIFEGMVLLIQNERKQLAFDQSTCDRINWYYGWILGKRMKK